MTKEIGPREKALREMREAKQARNKPPISALKAAVAVAAQKRGKPRKAKK
jgi:hypothetical protein